MASLFNKFDTSFPLGQRRSSLYLGSQSFRLPQGLSIDTQDFLSVPFHQSLCSHLWDINSYKSEDNDHDSCTLLPNFFPFPAQPLTVTTCLHSFTSHTFFTLLPSGLPPSSAWKGLLLSHWTPLLVHPAAPPVPPEPYPPAAPPR